MWSDNVGQRHGNKRIATQHTLHGLPKKSLKKRSMYVVASLLHFFCKGLICGCVVVIVKVEVEVVEVVEVVVVAVMVVVVVMVVVDVVGRVVAVAAARWA